jgi:2-polyprenyl-6-methoxyphenol hydroxylase-like FAD-dependent oxidoreductase
VTGVDGSVDTEVVVVGGGIGGLATAFALASEGRAVRVLERASEFTEVGAGLQMAPNATRVLARWGMLDRVVDVGVRPRRLAFLDALSGEELTSLDLGEGFRERYGAPYVVLHRTDLLQVLVDGCRDVGVELVTDSDVSAVHHDEGGATVMVGDRRVRAEVVVAADGLRSMLRERLDPTPPVASGYVAYRGALAVSELPPEQVPPDLDDVVVHLGPGCHLVQYALRRGEILNTVAVFESPAFGRGEAEWGGPDELDAAFAGAGPRVQRGLASLWRDRRWPMSDRLPIDRWVDGRMMLTGDAAHPMLQYLAQGACQAIEDAACLADAVGRTGADGGVDWSTALTMFVESRQPRTARVQTTARTWGEIWHVDGVARMLRNELFRTRRLDDYTHVDWLYGDQSPIPPRTT